MKDGVVFEMFESAAKYFGLLGVKLDECAFQLCFDATRVQDALQWCRRDNTVVGRVDGRVEFTSFADLKQRYESKAELATFVMVFVINPLFVEGTNFDRLVAIWPQPSKLTT